MMIQFEPPHVGCYIVKGAVKPLMLSDKNA
jgi:hypothetical protein